MHEIQRHEVYQNVLDLYHNNPRIFTEYPFRVKLVNEMAIDAGGVSRDMFSAFGVDAYVSAFDGCNSLVPQAHPHIDIGILFPVLGTILSHGFLATGMLPVRIAFPVIAAVVLGPMVDIPDSTYISLADNVSLYEGSLLKRGFGVTVGSFPRGFASFIE